MKTKSFLFLFFLLVSLKASAQFNLLSNEKICNDVLPKFFADHNLSDSIKTKLLKISTQFISDRDAIKKKYFGDNPSPQVASGSPFFIENHELQAKRDTDIENLLGKKGSKDLAIYLSNFVMQKAKEKKDQK